MDLTSLISAALAASTGPAGAVVVCLAALVIVGIALSKIPKARQ